MILMSPSNLTDFVLYGIQENSAAYFWLCNTVYKPKNRNGQKVASTPSRKDDFWISKNYRGISLTDVTAKVEKSLPLIVIRP